MWAHQAALVADTRLSFLQGPVWLLPAVEGPVLCPRGWGGVVVPVPQQCVSRGGLGQSRWASGRGPVPASRGAVLNKPAVQEDRWLGAAFAAAEPPVRAPAGCPAFLVLAPRGCGQSPLGKALPLLVLRLSCEGPAGRGIPLITPCHSQHLSAVWETRMAGSPVCPSALPF